ncbi:MAG: polysaccharide biosynthesis protein, partial [Paracoccaceae bacterium]
LVEMPGILGMTYDQSALAAGNGRGYFALIAARATVQTTAFLLGAHWAGLGGALLGQGLAAAAVHPLIIRLARRHGVWDARHDLAMGALALGLITVVVALNWPSLAGLAR